VQAGNYADSRPGYPKELFQWISVNSSGHDLVWDVGTGSGQAALSLIKWFEKVYATDLDKSQIAAARAHPGIEYQNMPAHISELPDNSVDTITVATALHWFDFDLFWPEVQRVARPGALFCAWTYHWPIVDGEAEALLLRPILDILDPYWSEGNRLSWRGYDPAEIKMPFEVIETPKLACELNWTALQIANLIRSWSAHLKARKDGHESRLESIRDNAINALGSQVRKLKLPLNMVAGRIV